MPDDYYVSQYSGEEIDAAVGRAATGGALDKRIATFVNPNLLDNWYFCNPVDQRGGYVVPPGVAYAGESSGTTNKYYTVKSTYIYNDVKYAVFDVDGSECNVPFYACVRGYTGSEYGLDRWLLQAVTSCSMLVGDGYITLYAKNNDGLIQKFPANQFSYGDTITVSVLTDTELLSKTITLTESVQIYPYDNSIWHIAAGKTNGIWFVWPMVVYNQSAEQAINIKAAKLELGSQQTLAHQDENGNWVLNEIPDYGEQLARCQRYAVKLNGKYWMPLNSDDVLRLNIPLPVTMRTKPSVTFSQESKNTGTVSFDDNLSDKNQIQFYMAANGGWANVNNIFATADL